MGQGDGRRVYRAAGGRFAVMADRGSVASTTFLCWSSTSRPAGVTAGELPARPGSWPSSVGS
jgi:hypothetical protein